MKDRYIFPAILKHEDEGIFVEFPDLHECFTFAKDIQDALISAKEVLELCLYQREEDEIPIPEPSDFFSEKLQEKTVIYVDVWMLAVRDKFRNISIKKTLTIPKWLNDVAVENNINFSQLLQVAIKNKLNIY